MTNQEAIKYLQQIYPNGGHCWLDEQRMEAISMAVNALQEEPESIWHDANEEPNNMSHCLVFYGDKSLIGHYLHYEPVLYNKQDKVFVTVAYPHQTGYKVEQKSLDGGCVAEIYKDKRDRISISDITSWCYLNDLHNFTQKEEPAIEDLGEYINELSKQFSEVSFAKLSRIAVRVANWQKKQDQSTIELAEDHAMLAGMEKMKEEMMTNAIDGEVLENYDGKVLEYDDSILDKKLSNCKVFDKVKIIIIKED